MKRLLNFRQMTTLLAVGGLLFFTACSKDHKSSPVETPSPETPNYPEITSLSPNAGDTGVVVIIKGKYFGTDLSKVSVSFDKEVVVPNSLSDTKIVVKTPDHEPGEVEVVVKVNDLASEAVAFTYNEPIKEDGFKEDAAGWTIVGDAQGGYMPASYSPDGGVTDGYIYADDDVLGGVWYFNAPETYLGNKNGYYGATLKFSLFQNAAMDRQFMYEDVVFQGEEKTLFYLHDSEDDFPREDWTKYSIKISTETEGWYIGSYKDKYNGPEKDYHPASEEEMKEVLSLLTGFMIRGEFEVGEDMGGMDDIEIIITE